MGLLHVKLPAIYSNGQHYMVGKTKQNTPTKQQTTPPPKKKSPTTPPPQLKATNQKTPKQNIKSPNPTAAARSEHHKVWVKMSPVTLCNILQLSGIIEKSFIQFSSRIWS